MIHTTCKYCGMGGDTCVLRFARSPNPRYRHEKIKIGEGMTERCTAVYPAPRPIADPEHESCPAWRDVAGRSKEVVEKLVRQNRYTY